MSEGINFITNGGFFSVLVNAIFKFILLLISTLLKPVILFISSIFPDFGVLITNILDLLSQILINIPLITDLLFIPHFLLVLLMNYYVIKYSIYITVRGVKACISLYNKFKP